MQSLHLFAQKTNCIHCTESLMLLNPMSDIELQVKLLIILHLFSTEVHNYPNKTVTSPFEVWFSIQVLWYQPISLCI